MAAQLRRKGQPAPVYCDSGDQFSVEVHHGGLFIGHGTLKTYLDEKVDFFDYLEADTWSLLWFDDFVEQLGYKKDERLKFYWLLPGLPFPNGLRILLEDKDTNAMADVVSKVKNFVVYFDHDGIADGVDWDDIVANPVAELPKVLSPHKVQYVPKKVGEKLPVFYTDLEKRKVHQFKTTEGESSGPRDSSEESDGFIDSDNEMEDGDEDILETLADADEDEPHVAEVIVKDSRKAKGSRLKPYAVVRPDLMSEEEDTDDEGLDLPDSDAEGEGGHRFKSFTDEDMTNPTFSVGLVFPSVEKLREAINEYSVRHRVEIKMPRRWQLTGIPCCHAVSCLRHENIAPESVLPNCYSLDAYNSAYACSIWPCRDKSEWEKMDAPQVLPPVYEKRVGRPPKARKKQAHEVPGKNGPRLSRHGVTMHCSHCSEGGHNSAGCRLKRMGFSAGEAKALVATTQATLQREAEEQAMRAAADQVPAEQVIENETPNPLNMSATQPPSIIDMTQASTTVLSQMLGEETLESSLSQPQGPLPDPTFILSNQPVQRPSPLNTSTVAGRAALAKKRKASTGAKTSSKKTKASTSRSSKRSSQVQEEGHPDNV